MALLTRGVSAHRGVSHRVAKRRAPTTRAASGALVDKSPAQAHAAERQQLRVGVRSEAQASPLPAAALLVLLAATPEPAHAATGANSLAGAAAAYGHYLSIMGMVSAVAIERVTISAKPTKEDIELLTNADIAYGVFGVVTLLTGVARARWFGKGWEFYAHEPLFWVKLALYGVMGASSLLVTTKVVQMAIALKDSPDAPPEVGEELEARMVKIINGELLALFSIPLMASLMSRGFLYSDGFPWPVGAAIVAAPSIGLSVKYVREALALKGEWEKAVEKAEA